MKRLPPGFGDPPPGPFQREFWRSPLRGPWLTSFLGTALLPLIVDLRAYRLSLPRRLLPRPRRQPDRRAPVPIDVFFLPFDWPTSPSWLYALTQGLHVAAGVAAIPILLAKLWSAMPKLFEWPPVRSLAHALDRASLALLVGGSLFVFFTGILNIQLFYPWDFSLRPGSLLRRLHLPRGARPAPGDQGPGGAARVSRARRARPAAGRPRAHRAGARASESTTAPPAPRRRRSAAAG